MRTFLISLFFPASIFAQSLEPQNPLRFLALGDSYTIGQSVPVNERWPVQLSDSLAARGILTDTLSIIATTGWRTDNLINAITNQDLQNRNYNFVSLLIGVNNQYQSMPFSQYATEFPALLDSAIRYADGDKSHVFVVSIPDYAFTPFGQSTGNPLQISNELDEYNAFNRHIADSMEVKYFDITPISRLGIENPLYVANDGLHPSGIQYTEWVKLMLETIDEEITGFKTNSSEIIAGVEVWPNPSSDYITIKIPENSELNVEIIDATGKTVAVNSLKGNTATISVADLPAGIYFIKIGVGGRSWVRKIIRVCL